MLGSEWERCKPWIKASISESPLADSIETIEKRLEAGSYNLASSPNAAAIVEIANFDGKRAMIVRFGGGDLRELLDEIEPRVCLVAKQSGCEILLSEGRSGWKRSAEAKGYKLAWITMVKEI